MLTDKQQLRQLARILRDLNKAHSSLLSAKSVNTKIAKLQNATFLLGQIVEGLVELQVTAPRLIGAKEQSELLDIYKEKRYRP